APVSVDPPPPPPQAAAPVARASSTASPPAALFAFRVVMTPPCSGPPDRPLNARRCQRPPPDLPFRNVRVLVVEDEARLAERLAAGAAAEGGGGEGPPGGPEGLWRGRETTYGAVVLDLMLPGMNGFRVCAAL